MPCEHNERATGEVQAYYCNRSERGMWAHKQTAVPARIDKRPTTCNFTVNRCSNYPRLLVFQTGIQYSVGQLTNV